MKATRSTRSKPVTSGEDDQATKDGTNKVKELAPTSSNPPMLFVLPENTSPDARIVTLPNPATSYPGRYYFCPEQGIYEFTKIAAPKKTPRSWLLAPAACEKDANSIEKTAESAPQAKERPSARAAAITTDVSKGYAIQDADLLVATPLDPVFVLLPALVPKPDETKQLFLSIEDHLDALAENSKHLKHLIRADKLRQTFERRADAVCDSVDMGDEKMYRLSNDKLLAELVRKAKLMTANGLPVSMEQHFVQEALKVPVMTVQREESSLSFTSQDTPTPALESQTSEFTATPSFDTQDSTTTVQTEATSFSTTTTATTTTNTIEQQHTTPSVPEEIVQLLRLRTALSFLLSSYIPLSLRANLQTLLASSTSCPIDFAPLQAHLDKIATTKKEQQALRSLSDNISRKRPGLNDEEAEEARLEKKRKKDDEELKKKNTSRGVKQLAKVNTTGMMKLSSFFTKGPAKKKA